MPLPVLHLRAFAPTQPVFIGGDDKGCSFINLVDKVKQAHRFLFSTLLIKKQKKGHIKIEIG